MASSYGRVSLDAGGRHEGLQPSQSPDEKQRNDQPWSIWVWSLECAGLFVSLACQVGLIVILTRMSDHPLKDWQASISLNAMVAVLSTISRMTLLAPVASCIGQLKWGFMRQPRRLKDFEIFDNASRGPYGSLMLLLRLPSVLAALGAITTLVSMGFGAFSQQIIQYETRDVLLPNSSVTFGYADHYGSFPNISEWGSGVYHAPVRLADWTMRGAVMKALYNLDLTPEFNCSSVCHWNGTYTTLGFGYECKNVTEATLSTKQCDEPSETTGGYNCNMTTPGNVTITTSYVPTQEQTLDYVSSNTSTDWNPRALNWPGSSSKSQLRTEFIHIAQYLAEYNMTGGDVFSSNVTECSIRLTSWDISSASAQGSSFTMDSTEVQLDSTATLQESNGENGNFSATITRPGSGSTFTINVYDWMAITSFILNQLKEVEDKATEVSKNDEDIASPVLAASAGNITDWVPRMTRAMTDVVRSGSSKQLAQGSSSESVVYVGVGWAWAIVPFATEGLALILLLLTMWKARPRDGKGPPLWKSSALALLFHDVQPGRENAPLMISSNIYGQKDLDYVSKLRARLTYWRADENDYLETEH